MRSSSTSRPPPVELVAIGIGHDVTRYYRRAVVDVEQLGGTMMGQLSVSSTKMTRRRPRAAKATIRHRRWRSGTLAFDQQQRCQTAPTRWNRLCRSPSSRARRPSTASAVKVCPASSATDSRSSRGSAVPVPVAPRVSRYGSHRSPALQRQPAFPELEAGHRSQSEGFDQSAVLGPGGEFLAHAAALAPVNAVQLVKT